MIELVITDFEECTQIARAVCEKYQLDPSAIHVSKDAESAAREIERLDNLTEMQMAI